MKDKKISNEEKLREENKNLKKALAICLNRPLINQIKGALERIGKGDYVTEEQFFRDSPLRVSQ